MPGKPGNIMGNSPSNPENKNGGQVLIKCRHRVQKHGEVFTPQWIIDKMLAIPGIEEKLKDVFSTFLEPSAGEGAFLLAIEEMKLGFITQTCDKNTWGRYALWVLSSIYGIELLEDNLSIARQNMLELFKEHYKSIHGYGLPEESDLYRSAHTIICANVVQGNTLTHRNFLNEYIVFNRWKPTPDRPFKVKRIPFIYSDLSKQMDASRQQLLSGLNEHFGAETTQETTEGHIPRLPQYMTVDIEQVWREEKENV